MTAINVVRTACEKANLASALDAHNILLSTANRANAAIQKEGCDTETFAYAQKAGVALHESACMIQCVFDVEVDKFPTQK